jgi:hypothetical protein
LEAVAGEARSDVVGGHLASHVSWAAAEEAVGREHADVQGDLVCGHERPVDHLGRPARGEGEDCERGDVEA